MLDDSFRNIELDEVRNIESKGLQISLKKKKMDNILGNTFQEEDNIRRPRRTTIKTTSYNITSKKSFIINNKGKTLIYIY